ncbi:MAG: MCE family protein [Candidatus Gastranaerophilales bacterium]|nr:MCE family protein [Candidatus Gastranaerophilales bacterium]
MKKKYIWLIEIIAWLLIILGSLFYFVYNTSIKENVKNTYYIFFDDVDGLVKGSNVKLMGMNIGYVKDVKIFDNKVFVSFIVTKENITIPKQALANIEFYGLGGSTSLELTPSKNNTLNTEEIQPNKTYRVQDLWDGQELVANVMIDIYGGIGRMIHSTGMIENKQMFKQSKLVEEFSRQTGAINTAQSVMIYKLTENAIKGTLDE